MNLLVQIFREIKYLQKPLQSLGIAKPLQTLGIAKLLQQFFPWNQMNFAKPLQSLGIALENAIFYVKLNHFVVFVYLANHVKILLHDHFSGCIEIAKSLGTQFHPSGLRPLGWNCPLGFAISMHPSKWSCNNIMYRLNNSRTFQSWLQGYLFLRKNVCYMLLLEATYMIRYLLWK